jgi:hypothetical protein
MTGFGHIDAAPLGQTAEEIVHHILFKEDMILKPCDHEGREGQGFIGQIPVGRSSGLGEEFIGPALWAHRLICRRTLQETGPVFSQPGFIDEERQKKVSEELQSAHFNGTNQGIPDPFQSRPLLAKGIDKDQTYGLGPL